ncbi:MAG: hypothetical protein ACREB3_13280, partial [Burkholderiales bacterium]
MIWQFIQAHWRDLVEIIILAVVLYYGYTFVRRTRGAPVVNGFLFLLALTFLTTVLKFEVLSSLLRT